MIEPLINIFFHLIYLDHGNYSLMDFLGPIKISILLFLKYIYSIESSSVITKRQLISQTSLQSKNQKEKRLFRRG